LKQRQSTKSFEQGSAIQVSHKLGEKWELTPRESPDFLVITANGCFGLEVTQCQIGLRRRKSSRMREAESARQHWLNEVRADYEAKGGPSLNCKYWGDTTEEARSILIEALLTNDFTGAVETMKLGSDGGARLLAFETPNTHWEMPVDRAGEISQDGSYLQRVIDEKAGKLEKYREACADVRLLVVADQLYNSGRLLLEPDFRPNLCGFDAVYFFAYPRTVIPFYRNDL
jgi:hypothetical protein